MPVLFNYNWLPIRFRIDYKVKSLFNGLAVAYHVDLLNHHGPSRPLCSADAGSVLNPRIPDNSVSARAFSYTTHFGITLQ